MGNRTDGKMTGDEKKKRDPIFSACFVIFILAAVGVLGVYIDEHYLTEDHTKVAYGDTVHVKYTGTFYDYAGSDLAVEFDSGDDLDFTADADSDVLQKFWEACVGHEVGDTVRVQIDPEDGYIAGSISENVKEVSIPKVETMTKYQFESVYDYDLRDGAQTMIKTMYGWDAYAIADSTSQTVTLIHNPVVGEEYTYGLDEEESDVTVKFKVTSSTDDITFTASFEGVQVVDEATGEIQMVELQFGNETWQVTNVTDSGFTYKTCENTGNQTLYFVIEITSIS